MTTYQVFGVIAIVVATAIIGLIIGHWLGYRAGRRQADWWRSHSKTISDLYEEQREFTRQYVQLTEQAVANTERTRKALTQLLPRGVREEVLRLNGKVEASFEATETDEFPSELDLS